MTRDQGSVMGAALKRSSTIVADPHRPGKLADDLMKENVELRYRLEMLQEWMQANGDFSGVAIYQAFTDDNPEAADWFDEEGLVKRWKSGKR